ncbi:MAG: four helix bundle protein [Pseudomonadota bacterium]
MRDFRKLRVWKEAHKLTLAVYKASRALPYDEVYGLKSQMRRSCVSIPANIAEGCGRNSKAELVRFPHIAAGSSSELDYYLILAHDLDYLADAEHKQLSDTLTSLKRMLVAFTNKLKT